MRPIKYIFCAAVQLASHPPIRSAHHNILEFISELGPYLTKAKKTTTLTMYHAEKHLGISNASMVDEQSRKPLVWTKESKKLLCSMKMPWLVPACNREKQFPRRIFQCFPGLPDCRTRPFESECQVRCLRLCIWNRLYSETGIWIS